MRGCGWVLLLLFFVDVGRSARVPRATLRRKPECRPGDFTCKKKFQCLAETYVCDGQEDCIDGTDEVCNSVESCPPSLWKCDYGACIPKNFVCDGKIDCVDGSDEDNYDCHSRKKSKSEEPVTMGRCENDQSPCNSGECIATRDVCNGRSDCKDGSDETYKRCFIYEGFRCLPQANTFRCDYGACVSSASRCDGKNDCVDGSDEKDCPQLSQIRLRDDTVNRGAGCRLESREGTLYRKICPNGLCTGAVNKVRDGESFHIECEYGYRLPSKAKTTFFCNGDKLEMEEQLRPCQKWCPPLESDSMDITCKVGNAQVNCSNWSRPGTESTMKCKEYFTPQSTVYPATVKSECLESGEWESAHLRCILDCGRTKVTPPHYSNKIANGVPTKPGEYPWYAGLYRPQPETNETELFCGGSIIAPHLIITAAHCIEPDIRRAPITPTQITVVVGKHHRSWKTLDVNEKRHKVKRINVGKKFTGEYENHYEQDIAVIELLDNISFNNYSQPVCIDWKKEATSFQKLRGNLVGFGRNENEELSSTLQLARLAYHPYDECSIADEEIAFDKFCAAAPNVNLTDTPKSEVTTPITHAAPGDSGGGFTFEGTNNITYLYGILSYRPPFFRTVSFFTNVTHYLDWMKDLGYANLLL